MKFDKFSIFATPHITDAYCECGDVLREVSNGVISSAMFCPKCENVYALKLIKVPRKKVSEEYMKQARAEIGRKGLNRKQHD